MLRKLCPFRHYKPLMDNTLWFCQQFLTLFKSRSLYLFFSATLNFPNSSATTSSKKHTQPTIHSRMSTSTNRNGDKGDGSNKKPGGGKGKQNEATILSKPKKAAKGKKDSNETPNADGSLKFLEPNSDRSLKTQSLDLLPDSAIEFKGFKTYHPKRDFVLSPGK